ncbi:MAG: hypothetical protein JXA96_17245 [Sedimentisphaerales bacterium]|nr:hypothetical protein [Sedimentisphaerales bacterium]
MSEKWKKEYHIIYDEKDNLIATADSVSLAQSIVHDHNTYQGLVDALEMIQNRLLANGEWDDGCFYYHKSSASELEEPLNLIEQALSEAQK